MSAEAQTIRALTWNLHGFVGRSGRRDPVAATSAVHGLDADILALQEVDERGPPSEETRAFIMLREAFGRHSAEARTLRSPDGDYGHVLMSRWPMHDVVRLDLAVHRREPRMAISCRVESPEGDIRVLAAHLGLAARERRHQLELIRAHLDEACERAALVLGDFNEWRPGGPAMRQLCPPFAPAAARPSYPSRWPLFALDRIWCRAPLRAIRSRTVREFRHLSDHLPVAADLLFGGRA